MASERFQVGGRNLVASIGSGIVLGSSFVFSNFAGPGWLALVIASLASLLAWETAGTLKQHGFTIPWPILVAVTWVALFGSWLHGADGQIAAVALAFLATVGYWIFAKDRHDVVKNTGMTVLLAIWVPFLASYAVRLNDQPDGPVLVLAVIGAAIFNDIGGFVFGVKFGKHKVAPTISPAKSWEGLIGGMVTVGVLGALVLPNVGDTFVGRPLEAAALAMLCGFAGFVGDLTESLFKRDLGIKDFGHIIPGHGGVLDRVDGIVIALPVGYYVVQALFV